MNDSTYRLKIEEWQVIANKHATFEKQTFYLLRQSCMGESTWEVPKRRNIIYRFLDTGVYNLFRPFCRV